MAQNVEGYNQHPPVVIPIQQNIPRQQVRQNKNNDKMCFGNKGSNCFSYSYSTLRINKNERKRK